MSALQSIVERAREAGCDAALIVNPINIRYLTGYHSNAYSRPLGLLIPTEGVPTLLMPRLEAEQARALTAIADVRDYVEWAEGSRAGGAPHVEWLALLTEVLRERHLAIERVAVEDPSRVRDLGHPVDASGWVEALRIIKSHREVENHRRAGALAGVGLDAALAAVREGVSEREIYAAAAQAMLREAARTLPYEPVAIGGNAIVGPRSASLHMPATGARPRPGNLVFVVLVASVGGSWCELSRTTVAGNEPSEQQARVFRAVERAASAARACLRPGVVASAVDLAARTSLAQDGFVDVQPMRTGHGLGMSGGSEAPQLGAGDSTPLAAGMVVSIEPSVCIPELGGVCWSDNFVITEGGADQLTSYPQVVP